MKNLEVVTRNLGDSPSDQSVLIVADTTELAAVKTAFLSTDTIATLGDGSKYKFNAAANTGGIAGLGGGRWWLLAPNGNGLNVKTFGAIGDGVTDDSAAIVAALTAAGSNSEIVFPAGTYLTDPIVITNRTFLSLKGYGKSVIKSKTGAAAITVGDAAHALPVYNLILEDLEVVGNGALVYGLKLLACVNLQCINFRITDAVNITSAIYVDYSWDNSFFNCRCYTKTNGIVFGTDNANRNSFFGGRFESLDLLGIGVTGHGSANSFFGTDISSFKYGVVIGGAGSFSIISCYFEGNVTHDILLDGRTLSVGEPWAVTIQGNTFLGTGIETCIKEEMTLGDIAFAISVIGNMFRNYNIAVLVTKFSKEWLFSNNYFDTVTTRVSGQASKSLFISDGKMTQGLRTTYDIIPAQTAGTIDIDTVANLTAGCASFVEVSGLNQDGAKAFKILAVISNAGALVSSDLVYNNAGITAVQIAGGILQITTVDLGNYLFNISVVRWHDFV